MSFVFLLEQPGLHCLLHHVLSLDRSTYGCSADMGVKRVKKPRLYGNGSQAFKGCLTYGPNSNDDEDEDEDDEMEIYLGSVMPIDDLDSLPY